jgi:hypothetical protein
MIMVVVVGPTAAVGRRREGTRKREERDEGKRKTEERDEGKRKNN